MNVAQQFVNDDKIDVFGNGENIILFAHANSFPPASYTHLFDLLGDDYTIIAPKHPALWIGREPKRRDKWLLYLDFVHDVLGRLEGRPCWLLGHSMGALIAQHIAANANKLGVNVQGSILLDPAAAPWWALIVMRVAPWFLIKRLSFIKKALYRPERWSTLEQAYSFHRKSSAFEDISDEVLRDYIDATICPMVEGDKQVYTLSYSGAWEAQIYYTIPLCWPPMGNITNKNLVLYGSESTVYHHDFQHRDRRRSPQSEFIEVLGGHLFPFEKPQETVAHIKQFFR